MIEQLSQILWYEPDMMCKYLQHTKNDEALNLLKYR